MVAYELLTGQGFSRLMYKVLHEDAPTVRHVRPDLPESVESIVARAIHKDFNKRYKVGHDLASD